MVPPVKNAPGTVNLTHSRAQVLTRVNQVKAIQKGAGKTIGGDKHPAGQRRQSWPGQRNQTVRRERRNRGWAQRDAGETDTRFRRVAT